MNRFFFFRRFAGSWLAVVARWALLCAIAGVMFFSFKGIGETLTPWSQATLSLLANLYYPESGRDDVTVLLFRERDLTSLGPKDSVTGNRERLPFPLPYSTHVETLNALGSWSPRALLIDFAFVDARAGDDVEALLGAICELSEQGTKVYLATFYYWQEYYGLRKDLFLDGTGHQRPKCFSVVPISYSIESNGLAQTYSLLQGGGKVQAIPSAALRMFVDGGAIDAAGYDQKMDIVWGALPPQPRRSDTPCRSVSLVDSVLRLAKDGPRALERDCPYSNTLSAYSLWNETSDDVEVLLKGKFVLYGGAFSGTDDWLKSPVHGSIPGVYLHAMALDNLLVFGGNYKRVADHSFGAGERSVLIADGLIIWLGVAWYLMISRFSRGRAERGAQKNVKENVKRHSLFYLLMVSPYLILSVFAGGGLWLAGNLASSIFQGVFVCLLLTAGGVGIVYEHGLISQKAVRFVGMAIGERLVEYSWIALMAVLSGVVFYAWNLGPRNFWAFTAFLGFTQLIDKRLILIAKQVRQIHLRKMYRTAPWLARLLVLVGIGVSTGGLLFIFSVKDVAGPLVGLWSLLGGLAVISILALGILLLPWLYRTELVLVDYKKEKTG